MSASLQRRPQATAISIEDLVDKVRRGEIRLPAFQRKWKWRPDDVRMLFDSIYKGYPIGTLLFWKREALAARVEIGQVVLDAGRTADAWWVIDGQQRITALVGVLLQPDSSVGDDLFAVSFDLATEQFARPTRSAGAAEVPLHVVLDSERLLEWLDRYPHRSEHPEHIKAAIRLGKVVREYQMPVYVVEAQEDAAVREIFDRLNRFGRRLTQDEVFEALLPGVEPRSNSHLESLDKLLSDLRFGAIDRRWLLKAVVAIAGLDITQDATRQLRKADIPSALTMAGRALRDTVVFLRRDAGILRSELLPYGLPIPVIARFFQKHPEPRPRSRELLARWLWRGAVSGKHRGESIPEVRAALEAVGPDEEESVQRLLRLVPKRSAAWNLAEFNLRTARSRIEANAFLSFKPRSLNDGEFVDVESALAAASRNTFRRLVPIRLRPRPPNFERDFRRTSFGTIANRVFYPEGDDPMEATMNWVQSPGGPAVLASQAIPIAAAQRLTHSFGGKELVALLAERDELLRKSIASFVESRTRSTESDRPSLQSLIVSDPE